MPPQIATLVFAVGILGLFVLGDDRFPVELIDVPDDAVGQPPDMIVRGGYADYFVEGSDLSINARTIVRTASERESWYHDQHGMYLMWGKHIRKGINGRTKTIEDIAPTILYLLGLPQSRNFDGTLSYSTNGSQCRQLTLTCRLSIPTSLLSASSAAINWLSRLRPLRQRLWW